MDSGGSSCSGSTVLQYIKVKMLGNYGGSSNNIRYILYVEGNHSNYSLIQIKAALITPNPMYIGSLKSNSRKNSATTFSSNLNKKFISWN